MNLIDDITSKIRRISAQSSIGLPDYECREEAEDIIEAVLYGVHQSDATRDVLVERKRQIEFEGWAPEHDDQHKNGELAKAATCYASVYPLAASYWPWDLKWWKPTDRRRNLVKAAALILAEIERLDRELSKRRAA